MNRYVKCACAVFGMLFSLVGHAATSQSFSAYGWYGDDPDWDFAANDLVSQRVTPLTSGSAEFTVTVPRGYQVTKWQVAGGDDVLSARNAMRNSPAITLATDKTSYTYTYGDVTGTRVAIGVRLDPIPYKIAFNAKGGSGTMATMQVADYFANTNLTKSAFTRTGYGFNGWATNETTMARVFADKQSVTGASFDAVVKANDTANLYACWTANVYTVTFNANGGSVSPTSRKITYDATYGQLPTPTWTGHSFSGWYTEQSGGTKVSASTTMSRTENHTLYAHWSVIKHTITTATSGKGSGTVSGGGQYDYGATATLEAKPATGSRFVRWTDGNTANPRSVTVTGAATYTAEFALVTVKVTFDSVGGSSVGSTNITYGSAYGPLPTPTKAGHTFQGWYTAASGGLYVNAETIMNQVADHTLYAHWSVNSYVITVAKTGAGSGSLGGGGSYQYGAKATLTATAYSDSEFVKWSDGSTANPREVTVTGAKTYTAEFKLKHYTVTFAFKTATGADTNVVIGVDHGKSVTPPNANIWVGHAFDYWTPGAYTSVSSTHTEEARYTINHYTIQTAVDPSGNGTGSVSGGGSKAYGETVQLTANPSTGSRFVRWTDGNTANPRTVTVTGAATYTARFELVTVQVTFDSQGGSSVGSTNITYGSAYGQLPTPTMTGYKFDGWYTSSTGGSRVYDDTKMQRTENHSLYAHWNAAKYTITVATSGEGKGTFSGNGTYEYEKSATLTVYPSTGSRFVKWSDGDTANPRTVTVTKDATYTAVLALEQLEVTFSFRTATGGWTNEVRTVSYGKGVEPPDADIWIGHHFYLWTPENYRQVYSTHTETANYEEYSYIIHFDGNGGSCTLNDIPTKYTQQVTLNKVTADKVSRIGYVFAGWSLDKNAQQADIADGAMVSQLSAESGGTATLYAVWTPIPYRIAFAPGAGTGTMEPMTNVLYGVVTNLTPNAFKKTGCAFLRWKREGTDETYLDGAAVSNLTTIADATVTLTAVWDAPYWVKFESNGGTGTMAVQRFDAGETKQLTANAFTCTGYTFDGWSTNGVTGVVFKDRAELTDAFPVGTTNVLKAVWAANTYTVKFLKGGSDVKGTMMPDQTFTYGEAKMLTQCTYTRENFKFVGWSNTISRVVYADKASVSNLTTKARGEVPLLALWESTLSDLSKALDCDNLNWESVGDADYAWTVFADASAKSGKCVRQQSLWSSANNTLCADIHTNGTLRFFWKPTSATTKMTIGVYVGTTTIYSEQKDADAGLLNQWNEVNVTVPALGKDKSTATIKIYQEDDEHYEDDETPVYLYLDDMTWKPEGGMVYPEPTDENRVETSALSLTSEGWSLSFTGEENFDYQLLSTETLTPPDWQPFGDRIHGDGNPQSFVVPQDPAEPQRFFKIQTLQRQAE